MKRSWILLSVLIFVQAASSKGQKPLSVLFVGNSYTYYNNLPEVFAKIIATQRPVVTGMVAPGGMTLEGHMMAPNLEKSLRSRRWDYVVIQEQSSLSNNYLVDGVSRVVDYRPFWNSVHLIVAKIRATGAKPVLYMTWKRSVAPSRDQDYLDFAYSRIGQVEHCSVAPVGRAWMEYLSRNPKVQIYYKDGSHPNEVGTYISAATLAETIAHIDLRLLPTSLDYFPIDLDTEKVSISPKTFRVDAMRLQAIASAVRLAITGHAPNVPGPIPVPGIVGRTVNSIREMAGTYVGSTNMFSSSGMYLELSFDDQGKGIASIRPGQGQPDLSSVVQVSVDAGFLRFEMPGVSNAPSLLFKGNFIKGRLRGVCERIYRKGFSSKSEYGTRKVHSGDLAGFGHWSAIRG